MEHLDHPPPNDAKMARFLLLRAFIIALGGWGIIVPFFNFQDCSLCSLVVFKQFERTTILDKIKTTPTPPVNGGENGTLWWSTSSSLIRGGEGWFYFSFYSVRDCNLGQK